MSLDKSILLKSSLSIVTVLSGICGSQAMEMDVDVDNNVKTKPTLMLKVPQHMVNFGVYNPAYPQFEKDEKTSPKLTSTKSGMKRLNSPSSHAGLNDLPVSNVTCLTYIPVEIYEYLIGYLGNSKNNFEGVCKEWQIAADNVNNRHYVDLNEKNNYVTFNDCSTKLSQRMIYVSNKRLKDLIYMFNNITRNHGADIDRGNFERLVTKFIGKPTDKNKDKGIPFFDADHALKEFADLLTKHAAGHNPTPHQRGIEAGNISKADEIRNNLGNKLAILCNINDLAQSQNEIIMNYYIRLFINFRLFIDFEIVLSNNEELLKQTTSSLAEVIKNYPELMELRRINAPTHIQWKRIIELDFGATLQDLRSAAFSHFNAGLFAEAAGYCKQVVDKAGLNATVEDLRNAAFAYFKAGLFAEAAEYYKQVLDKSGVNATVNDLRNAAGAHFKAGLFGNAVGYYKQLIDKAGVNDTVDDLVGAVKTNFELGLFIEADKYMSRVINFPGYILSPEVEEISQKIRHALGK